MKLVMAILHDEDAFQIIDLLNENEYSVTKLASTGGFLRSGNTTIICGVEDDKVEDLISIIKGTGQSRKQITSINSTGIGDAENFIQQPVEVAVGGATVFVLDVVEFRKF